VILLKVTLLKQDLSETEKDSLVLEWSDIESAGLVTVISREQTEPGMWTVTILSKEIESTVFDVANIDLISGILTIEKDTTSKSVDLSKYTMWRLTG